MTAPPPAWSATSGAIAARAATIAQLRALGIEATADAGAFYPQPIGVLVGLPSLAGRLQAASTFEVPILIVSGDPLNEELTVDRLYALADDVARAVRSDQYRPSSWAGSVNAEPLPAIELAATVTIGESIGGP